MLWYDGGGDMLWYDGGGDMLWYDGGGDMLCVVVQGVVLYILCVVV